MFFPFPSSGVNNDLFFPFLPKPCIFHFCIRISQVIRIHSPMRAERKQYWSDVPSREMISSAHAAALSLKRSQAGQSGGLDQFGSCKVWGDAGPNDGPTSGSPDMSGVRKTSNYSKWEVMPFESLRKEARDHYNQMGRSSLYKMDGNKLEDLVCVRHSPKSEA